MDPGPTVDEHSEKWTTAALTAQKRDNTPDPKLLIVLTDFCRRASNNFAKWMNLRILRKSLKEWSIMQMRQTRATDSKGMSLLITSHDQLALTSCVAQCLFERLVFLGSNKSLTVAVECKLVLWNSLVLVEVLFCFWHSSLSLLARVSCTLRRAKGWLKAEDCGGEGLQWSSVFSHDHHFQQSSARLLSFRKGGKVSPTLALLALLCDWGK